MVSTFTTNKVLEKPGNGDYVDTWNIPVNGDMDVIDQAFGGWTQATKAHFADGASFDQIYARK